MICFISFKRLMIRRCTLPCASGWRRRLGTPWQPRQGEHYGGDGGDGDDCGDAGGDGGDGGDGGHGGGAQYLDS